MNMPKWLVPYQTTLYKVCDIQYVPCHHYLLSSLLFIENHSTWDTLKHVISPDGYCSVSQGEDYTKWHMFRSLTLIPMAIEWSFPTTPLYHQGITSPFFSETKVSTSKYCCIPGRRNVQYVYPMSEFIYFTEACDFVSLNHITWTI